MVQISSGKEALILEVVDISSFEESARKIINEHGCDFIRMVTECGVFGEIDMVMNK